MANKKWTFLLRIYTSDKDGNVVEKGEFEALGISPFKIVAGAKSIVMESESYDHLSNAAAMGDFVSNIGDKNTLSFKKLGCPVTNSFYEFKNTGKAVKVVNLFITPLSAINGRLKNKERFKALFTNSVEWLQLKEVKVTSIWVEISPQKKGPEIVHDYVTFQTDEKIIYRFKGKDW